MSRLQALDLAARSELLNDLREHVGNARSNSSELEMVETAISFIEDIESNLDVKPQREKPSRRREEGRRAERKAEKRRVTGQAPPTTISELMSQLNIAKAGATVSPTDFKASIRILAQVRDWLFELQQPNNIQKHFSLSGINLTFAST